MSLCEQNLRNAWSSHGSDRPWDLRHRLPDTEQRQLLAHAPLRFHVPARPPPVENQNRKEIQTKKKDNHRSISPLSTLLTRCFSFFFFFFSSLLFFLFFLSPRVPCEAIGIGKWTRQTGRRATLRIGTYLWGRLISSPSRLLASFVRLDMLYKGTHRMVSTSGYILNCSMQFKGRQTNTNRQVSCAFAESRRLSFVSSLSLLQPALHTVS